MPNTPLSFCFLLFDGFSNMVLANALEPLRAARNLPGGPGIVWEIITVSDHSVKSSSGLSISPSVSLSKLRKMDYLMIVSGYDVREHATKETFTKLQALRRHARRIVGIDTGSWLMAASGMLESKEATIHWHELNTFAETFPEISVSDAGYVEAGHYLTCGGASSALDMVLNIIREHFGAAVAFDVSNLFIYDARPSREHDRSVGRFRSAGSRTLRSATNTMVENIENPISLVGIAAANSISVRSLNRIFLNELNTSPGKYYQILRLTYARDMATETDSPLTQIAIKTGFSSTSALSRAFTALYGMSISRVRKSHTRS